MKRTLRAGALALAATVCTASGAAAAAAGPTLINWGPDGQHGSQPGTIFLSADAGPAFVKIHWTGWGTAKAVGHGVFKAGQTGGNFSEPATIVLTKLAACRTGGNRTYQRGVLTATGKHPVHLTFPHYAPIAYCE